MRGAFWLLTEPVGLCNGAEFPADVFRHQPSRRKIEAAALAIGSDEIDLPVREVHDLALACPIDYRFKIGSFILADCQGGILHGNSLMYWK